MATLQNIGKLKYRGKDGKWHPLPVVVQDANGGVSTISGKGAPTSATQGKVNQLYRDEDTQRLYICTAVDGGYTWAAVSGGSADVDATLTKAGYAADAKAAGDALAGKLDKAQGKENAGTVLVVADDGNVYPLEPSYLPGVVSYTRAQGLTYEQKVLAKANIGAGTLRNVYYWQANGTPEDPNGVMTCAIHGDTCICGGEVDSLPDGMQAPVLVIYGSIDRGYRNATAFDGSNATWTFTVNLRDYSCSTPIKKSGVPAPTTAQVGQIVKVKAVDADGKITETEAVDMPSGESENWTLMADQTTTEIVREISVALPKSVKHVVSKIWCPATGAEEVNVYITVKIGATALFYYIPPKIPDNSMTSQLTLSADSIGGGYWRLSYYANRGGKAFDLFGGHNQNHSVAVGVVKATYTEANTFAIMVISPETTQQFPVGTILKVWGY